MSPTIFRFRRYRFFFFSREEARMHIHIQTPDGEAKFWLKPNLELAMSQGIRGRELKLIEKTIREKRDEIEKA